MTGSNMATRGRRGEFHNPKRHTFKPQHHSMGPLHDKPPHPDDICHEELKTTVESHGFVFETQCGRPRKEHLPAPTMAAPNPTPVAPPAAAAPQVAGPAVGVAPRRKTPPS